METNSRSNLVMSIIKALKIIELLDSNYELSISQISQNLGIQKSTIHRLVSTLKYQGYVVQNPDTLKYRNSIKMFEIGSNTVEKMGLRKGASLLLERLNGRTGETVNLAILDKFDTVYIDKVESQETIKAGLSIGSRVPAYCGALGKVLLAYMSMEKLDKLLEENPLIMFTPNTICSIEGLKEELKIIRTQDFAVDNEEYITGLKCIAAPVRNYRGEVVAAISIAVPTIRCGREDKFSHLVNEVVKTARDISQRLGCK